MATLRPLKTEFKVGLFIVLSVLMIAGALGFMAHKKGLFATMHTYTLSSRSGEDLAEGMPLYFSGFRIGKIDALELNQEGVVLLKITVPDRHTKWIRENSVFSLYKPLIGSPKLIVATENLKSPLLSSQKVLEIVRVDDINEAIKQLSPIIAKISQIVSHIETITGNLANPKGDVNKILRNAETLTGTLAAKKSLMEMVIGNEETVQSIHESLKRIRDILNKVDGMAKKTDEQLYGQEGVFPLVRDILRDVVLKLQKLNGAIDNVIKVTEDTSEATKDLKDLRRSIDSAVNSLDELIKDIDNIVPLQKKPEIKLP